MSTLFASRHVFIFGRECVRRLVLVFSPGRESRIHARRIIDSLEEEGRVKFRNFGVVFFSESRIQDLFFFAKKKLRILNSFSEKSVVEGKGGK